MFYGIQHPVRRKLLALLLSVLMICSTAAPAFADLFAFETVFPPEQEPVFKDGEVKAWSGDYSATVTYGADAELSEGTQLVMQEIPKGTTQYDKYLAAATATVGEDEKAVFVRFFDIELQDKDGNPVEPEARVAVNISSAELSNADKITVVHFPAITGTEENGVEDIVRGMIDAPLGDTKGALSLRGGKKLAADIPMEGVARKSADGINSVELEDAVETPIPNNSVEAQDGQFTPAIEVIDAETSSGVISFFADGFSVYGIIYTVSNDLDGKTYTSASMPGAESMPLAEVIRGLGIVSAEEVDAFVSRISTVVSANEDVAVVETIEDILNVRVLKEGDAQIVITMQDGATFRVDVMAEGETTAGDETATISTVGDLYLPTDAKVEVKVLNEEQGEEAIAAVQAVEETADSASEAKTAYQVFDISLDNVEADRYDGFQVEVNLPENVVGKDFHLYHIHDGETTEIGLNTVSKPADETGLEVVSGFTFETKDFSEFVLKYTVDFSYNGYAFSIRGGDMVCLKEVALRLGLTEDADAFIQDVATVEFSAPELIWVGKVKVDTTLDALKEEKGLECQYSDELTDEEIEEINAQTLVAGDWVLISLQPFTSVESLTIAMTDGTKYVVQVTDAVSEDDALDALNNNGYIDLTNDENTLFLHVSAESSVTENEQERDVAFKLTFTYSLEENVVKAIDQYNQPFSLKYDLSSTIDSSPLEIRNNSNGVISIGSRRLGTYTIVNGVVTLTFTDPSYFDGRTSFTGYFTLTAETNETELGSNDEWTYEFPGTGDTIPIHYKKTVEDGSKSVNSTKNADGSYTLHYTANINVNSDLDSMTFNDTLSGLQTLEASSVKINGTSVSISQTGDGFTFDVASALGTTGVAKGSYQVTYDTKVTAAQLEAMTADKTIEKNTASWKVNGNKDVPGGETTVEINKPVPPIPVEKTSSSSGANQPGDTITYNVSYGDANTALAGFHISDSITDVVIPQGTDVTLNYGNGQTVTVPFNSQATDSSYGKGTVTLFDYTFPAGTEGNGPVTVTYSVKLIDADTAKENGVFDSTSVVNTAIEHRQNTSDTETTTVTYEKEPSYTVEKTASANPTDEDGHWLPGSTITYTLTIGDADTNMAGVNIKDVMTDLQVLQGDIMIQVGNGSQMRLSNYVSDAIKWTDDGQYSANDVELFNFNMPSNAGNGPVVITYTTKVISQEQATANGIYGDVTIKNTGYGGKQSDGTNGTGSFNPYPIEKTVTKSNADVNGQTVEMGDTVHYTLTFGDSTMNMGGVTILDEMTDLQKLVSDVTIRKPDGTTVTMPMGSGQWSDNGVVWNYFDDGKYSTQMVRVFSYKLPSDFGNGPITVEYDTQIISEDEANESGIKDTKDAYNIFTVNNHQAQTDVKIEFPTDPKHEPQISKKFDKWDIDNNKVYWTITVEKTADSAYPLENIKVSEGSYGGITITESKVAGWNNHGISEDEYKLFDVVNAVVTTDDGTVLTPGVDYTIDKDEASFTFPILNEKVHINFAFTSPIKIIDGFKMHNKAHVTWVNDWTRKVAEADAEYNKPGITIVKNGAYTEDDRLIKWEVSLNPSKNAFVDSDPIHVWFEDQLPSGMTLVNYSTKSEDNPSISVYYKGNWWYDPFEVNVSVDENNAIRQTDIAAHTPYNGEHGLDGNNIVVTYFTKLSDDEWDRITSSASGSETFENKVTVTAGNGEKFSDSDDVTVTTDGYLKKYDTTHDPGGIVIDPDTNANSKNITYAVEVNPNGYVLNSHDPLSLTDYISTNMDLDTASVQIYNAHKGADGRLVADSTVPAGLQVSYNDDSRLLSIQNIPDETPLLLTYTCVARAQGEDTFRNTATLIGGGSHSSSTSEKHTIQTNDAGTKIDGIMLSIHKIDENNISQNLSGAKFQLYECQLVIGELTNPETYSQSWWEDLLAKVDRMTAGTATQDEIDYVKENFKITDYVPVGDAVETGSTGYTQLTSLNEHKLYAWVETEAPEGYSGYAPDDYHYFVGYQHIDVNSDVLPQPLLSAEEQLARKHAAWALDDACQFANDIRVASMSNLTTWTATNVETHYTSITAGKVWEGDSDNLFETRPTDGIQLQLWVIKADGTRETVGEPVSINVNEDTGEWPTYIWNRLPSEDDDGNTLKYTVTEKRVENYSTTYSDNGAGQSSGTITVTNRMIPKSTDIYVEKVFAEGTEKPASIKVTLYVIKTDKNDVVSDPEETSYEAILSETNSWKWHWDRLPTTQVIDGKAYYLSYTVMEDTAALERQGFCYTVSYSDNGEGVIETTENEPLVITNTKETGKITVKKIFSGVTDETDLTALQNGLTVTVRGKDVGGKGVDILTLSWNDVKDGGYEITHLPIDETYTVTEEISADSVLPKYTVTSETVSSATVKATVDGETAELKNVYEEAPQTGSLTITKNVTVNGHDTTTNLADGAYVFSIAGPDSETIVKHVQITVTDGKAASYKVADGPTEPEDWSTVEAAGNFAADAETREAVVSNLAAGDYTITETAVAGMTTTVSGGKDNKNNETANAITVTVTAGENIAATAQATFTNDKTPMTSFNFNKIWLGPTGNIVATSTSYQDWQDDITVTIKRKAGASGAEDSNFALKYTISKSEYTFTATMDTLASKLPTVEGTLNALTLTGSSTSNVFNFTLPVESLRKYNDNGTEWVYYVVESKVPLYVTSYGTATTGDSGTSYSVTPGASDAKDGGVIVNQTFGGYELPSTGGPGTRIFTILGSMLIMLAGAGFILLQRKKRVE